MNKKILIWIVVIAAVLLGVWYFAGYGGNLQGRMFKFNFGPVNTNTNLNPEKSGIIEPTFVKGVQNSGINGVGRGNGNVEKAGTVIPNF